MTKDETIEVGVRLDTALHALQAAYEQCGTENETDEQIAEAIEEAQQAAATARSLCRNISGA